MDVCFTYEKWWFSIAMLVYQRVWYYNRSHSWSQTWLVGPSCSWISIFESALATSRSIPFMLLHFFDTIYHQVSRTDGREKVPYSNQNLIIGILSNTTGLFSENSDHGILVPQTHSICDESLYMCGPNVGPRVRWLLVPWHSAVVAPPWHPWPSMQDPSRLSPLRMCYPCIFPCTR